MKKVIAFVLAVALVFSLSTSLVGCGGKNKTTGGSSGSTTHSETKTSTGS